MALFSWAQPKAPSIVKKISSEGKIYFISDLHLGDGTRSDAFMGKDNHLIQLIEQIKLEKAHLVIVGDAIDFHQALSISRVIQAHARLMRALSSLAEEEGVTYIFGNHDYDILLFRGLLHFDVCSELHIDDVALVRHGYEYDPFIGQHLEKSHITTRVHHLIERIFDTWIRLPLENFYTIENRLCFWLCHKLAMMVRAKNKLLEKIGLGSFKGNSEAFFHHWAMNQISDPANLFEEVRSVLNSGSFQYLVTGHSHLPGKVQVGENRTYINTGSWTFASSQYTVWDGEDFIVRDWMSGQEYTDHAYKPLLDRRYRHMDFMSWWDENYMGWLRFRMAEEGRIPILHSNHQELTVEKDTSRPTAEQNTDISDPSSESAKNPESELIDNLD